MKTLDELRAMDCVAFNRAIAEAVGYRAEWFGDDGQRKGRAWGLIGPDGHIVGGSAGAYPVTPYWNDNDQMVTHEMFAAGIDEAFCAAPDYATDLNAAWELMPIQRAVWLRRLAGTPTHRAMITHIGDGKRIIEDDLTPARALATVWYAWKLAQERGA